MLKIAKPTSLHALQCAQFQVTLSSRTRVVADSKTCSTDAWCLL